MSAAAQAVGSVRHDTRMRDYWRAICPPSLGVAEIVPRLPGVLAARLRLGIGPRFYALYGLREKPVSAWPAYLRDKPVKQFFRAVNSVSGRVLTRDKLQFHRHCRAVGIPTVPVFGVIWPENVAAPEEDGPPAFRDAADLTALEKPGTQLFLKQVGGMYGIGAFTADWNDDHWSFAGREGSAEALYQYIRGLCQDDTAYLVQPRLRQHPTVARIMSHHGLGTIRAVTVRTGSGVSLLCACLRITTGTNHTDNFVHGAAGNLVACIDLTTGRLMRAFGSLSSYWPEIVEVRTHPDTGVALRGFQLPHWFRVTDMLESAARATDRLVVTGWDVALTDQGPLVVEASGEFDVDLLQVALQRGLKPDLKLAASGVVSRQVLELLD